MNEVLLGGTDPDDNLSAFAPIDAWVFDLDDTLYAIGPELAALYDGRMRSFIEREVRLGPDEASRLQHDLFERHGATARGLFVEHGIQPDEFLEYVHDIDHTLIEPDPGLSKLIGELPGRRYVLTNSPISHATRAIEQIGMSAHFTEIFDFASLGGYTKPDRRVYDALIAATGVLPVRTAMFEDLARNLVEPQRLGMVSVLVAPPRTRELFRGDWDLEAGSHPAVDFVTDDLIGFLTSVLAEIRSPN